MPLGQRCRGFVQWYLDRTFRICALYNLPHVRFKVYYLEFFMKSALGSFRGLRVLRMLRLLRLLALLKMERQTNSFTTIVTVLTVRAGPARLRRMETENTANNLDARKT